MTTNPDPHFERLQPPPGGLNRLKARLDAEERASHPARLAFALAASIAIVVALIVAFSARPGGPVWRDASDPALARLGMTSAAPEPLSIPGDKRGEMAATRVQVDDPRVVFYLVASARDIDEKDW